MAQAAAGKTALEHDLTCSRQAMGPEPYVAVSSTGAHLVTAVTAQQPNWPAILALKQA